MPLTDGSSLAMVTLFEKLVFEASVSVAFVSVLILFNTYYEAVFIDVAKFSYAFGKFFATALWMINMKISVPIGRSLDIFYDPLDYHCKINDKLKHFILDHDKRLTPFCSECCIVFAATVWQI